MSEINGKVSLNFYYLFKNDSLHLAESAEKEQSKLKSVYARHSILSAVFASEAFINRIFDDFYVPGGYKLIERKMPLEEKWMLAPLTCRPDPDGTYDRSAQPFQSFSELIKIRNWFAHPKSDNFFPASLDSNSTITTENDEEIPWISVLPGSIWDMTQFPKNPFHLNEDHARTAIHIVDEMVSTLKVFLPEQVTDKWIRGIVFKASDSSLEIQLTHDSLWSGYSGLAI